jgi:hypothetical protein
VGEIKMIRKQRIFFSSIMDHHLDDRRRELKREILRLISEVEFEPQVFFESGLAIDKSWSFNTISDVMQRCQGAVMLGFPRWEAQTNSSIVPVTTEFTHYEGALALSQGLPTFVLAERGIADRGIFYSGGGQFITYMPPDATRQWTNDDYFRLRFNTWRKSVEARYEVFFGYSSAARATADSILNYLTNRLGAKVKEYATGFQSGGSILEEIEKAAQTCLCGVFLFTCDDPLANGKNQASPRDNVIFEAGYFMKAKGKERTLIIREEGAKMPADIGGNIYLLLKDRSDTSAIRDDLRYFLETRL